ncbi:type III secretion system export apparatus subunit SctV [Salinisphaera sp.]|uniref:type III secretion system export apparatus subunit SctV n=1 Tax=Salinisphaera sp. TaxID=1914330 RepID=UPI002D799777|nr:type III secretion system export apparatus subunit SctV [Salinisphaera sp.]HET7314022.1 type III secretion system export apparatus subunit SctV [Salinisphaera sp.]
MKGLLARVNALALQASQRSDVVIASFIVLAIVMIIIPLPTPLVDVLIAINIAVSLLILLVTFYITHPVEFSALPPVILLATLFRLALAITTTRLILLQADAGEIISAFGHFVIAGQVVIGLVVFFIIAIAQFVVITKGAERVAEVAARFVLDALPGKQMSIDNDLRNGDIDAAEGKRRRALLERESQLYGAMDGAMKFVKGDAIAVLVILFINLIGGLTVGMVEHDMPFSEAIQTYSLLTVGDGLIAQIPALLISVGAGTVVTRVSSNNGGDLGAEIVDQLGRSDRALGLTAVILAAMAMIPGFSTAVFLLLAAAFGGAAWYVHRRNRRAESRHASEAAGSPADAEPGAETAGAADAAADRVMVRVGDAIAARLDAEALLPRLREEGALLQRRLGIDTPGIGWRVAPGIPADCLRIDLDDAPVVHRRVPPDCVFVRAAETALDELDIPVRQDAGGEQLLRRNRQWVDAEHTETLAAADLVYDDLPEVLLQALRDVLRRHAAEFVGIQETQNLLGEMQKSHPDLVGQVAQALSTPQIAATLRSLVEEDVPVQPMRSVLEAFAEQGGDPDIAALNAAVRHALRRSICHRYADEAGLLRAWAVAPELEQRLAYIGARIREGELQAIPGELSNRLQISFEQAFESLDDGERPVVVCSPNLRRPLYDWGRRNGIDLAVLAWSEIAEEYRFQSRGTIGEEEASSSNAPSYEESAPHGVAQFGS